MLASGSKLVFFTREWRCRTDSTFFTRENCKGKPFSGSTVLDPLVYYKKKRLTLVSFIVQELCESRRGRPGLSVLTSLLVSVDVKIYCTVLRHWSQLVPNMSTDI